MTTRDRESSHSSNERAVELERSSAARDAGAARSPSERIGPMIDRWARVSAIERDEGELRRVRLCTGTLMLLVVTSVIAAVAFALAGSPAITMYSVVAALGYSTLLWLIRAGVGSHVVVHAFGVLFTAIVMWGALELEDVERGPDLLIVIPVLITLSLGGRAGWAWWAVIVACTLVLASISELDPLWIRVDVIQTILIAAGLTGAVHAFPPTPRTSRSSRAACPTFRCRSSEIRGGSARCCSTCAATRSSSRP